MRLFILVIVAGLGVLVGVALYVGQEIVNPGTPEAKLTARLAEQQEAIAVAEKSDASVKSTTSDEVDTIDPVSDANIDAYKSQLRTAQYPTGTSSFDSAALRKQLPDIFQFPEQNAPSSPPIAIATVLTAKNVPDSAPIGGNSSAVGNNNSSALVPDAPTAANTPADVRSDTPVIKHLAAPEHHPSVATATNPNVHVETAPASEGRAARTRMIVSK